jgi:putative membrane protein
MDILTADENVFIVFPRQEQLEAHDPFPLNFISMNRARIVIFAGCATAILLLIWIYTFPRPENPPPWTEPLPLLNAILNSCSATLLSCGWIAIKKGRQKLHISFMACALFTSAIFLVCYLTYHHFHGDTRFLGQGWIRPTYFFILISHILLSVINLPMILTTVYYAVDRKLEQHKSLARWTLPIWIYVSISGVLVYAILNHWPC